MATFIGLLVVCFSGALMACCVFQYKHFVLGTSLWKLWSILLVGLSSLVLFRPDEEVNSGEDAGGYWNAALSYAQRGFPNFVDPALMRLPPDERLLFRYGHQGFGITKDAAVWAMDGHMSQIGPKFYPGYSLLLSLAPAAGFPYAAFWVSPVLALLCGILIARLAVRLTGQPHAGWMAYLLYILNPVIFWNARCLRAEWPASFLALAGIVLWLNEEAKGGRGRGYAGLLSGLSLAAAGLFHATALYVLLPALALAFFMTTRSRFWVGWWAGTVMGVLLVVGQWAFIADPYFFWPRVRQLFGLSWFLPAGVIAVLFAAGLRWSGGRIGRRFPAWAMRTGTAAGLLAALAIVAVVVYSLRHRTDLGHLPGLPEWSVAYISLTDFEGLARVISRGWFAFSLLGLFFLGTGSGERGRTGRLLLLLLGPASMTIGWVFNYMFETRRMLTFLVPLITLASVAGIFGLTRLAGFMLQRLIPEDLPIKRWVVAGMPWALAVLLLLSGVRGRWHLYTTWNDQGAFGFYREVSERVKAEGDFLLAEYTQMAAPVERLSGLPLLPVSWGYRSPEEYRQVEKVWRRLVTESPEERFLFISPFAGAALPGLELEPLFTRTLETRKLSRARRTVPMEVQDRTLTMHVSRVLPPGKRRGDIDYVRLMDGGNLGLSGQANFMHSRDVEMKGVPARRGAGDAREVDIFRPGRAGTLFVMVAAPDGVSAGRLAEGWRFTPVGERWAVVRIPVDGAMGDPEVVSLSSKGVVYLTDVFLLPEESSEAVRLELPGSAVEFTLSGVHSQWLRARAAAALPAGGGDGGQLMLLATHGRDDVEEVGLRVGQRDAEVEAAVETIVPGWRWYLMPNASAGAEGMAWHDFEVTPAWNPGLSSFPEDLGLRVAVIGVVE